MGFTDVPGKMGPADTVLGWVTNGVPQLTDRSMTLRDLNGMCAGWPIRSKWHPNPLLPIATAADRSQDYELLEGHIEGGRTSITFRRLLDTGDFDDRVITPGNMSVVWCVGCCMCAFIYVQGS